MQGLHLRRVTAGALVGCEDGTLALFEEATGAIKWQNRIGKGLLQPNVFHGEFASGYLVSDWSEALWFVGKDGKLIWMKTGSLMKEPGPAPVTYELSGTACAADILYRTPKGTLEEKAAPMGWHMTINPEEGQAFYMQARNRCDAGTVTVTIRRGDKVLKTASAEGAKATAFATAR